MDEVSEIVAFVVIDESIITEISAEYRIRQDISTIIPTYMLPQKIITLDELPVTNIGKTDRLALRKMI